MSDQVIILGPLNVGKSTLAKILAQKLDMPRCCLDDIQWAYLAETDFEHEKAKSLIRSDLEEFRRYTNPYLVSVVQRAIHEHPSHIIDFGAGHTAFDESDHIELIKSILLPVTRVLLLMPSSDIDVCLSSLPGPADGMRMNPTFIEHPLKHELANHVIYTLDKNPAEVADEAITWLQSCDA